MRKIFLGLLFVTMSSFLGNKLDTGCSYEIQQYETPIVVNVIDEHEHRDSLFNEAVKIIKKYETMHGPEHYPYVGYGHMILPGDNLSLPISESEADSILRVDLKRKMSYFNCGFERNLLLGMLSYNVGQYRLIKKDGSPRSNVARILMSDSVDVAEAKSQYTNWRKWNGKVVKSIERRRIEEFNLIYPQS